MNSREISACGVYEAPVQSGTVGWNYAAGRLALFLGCSMLVELVNFFLGKDMAWDTLNYHLYAGFSAVTNRFGQDYFAAGTSSYLNPYVYLPFYLMVHAGWSALAISATLAIFQSTILWVCFELAVVCALAEDERRRFAIGTCAMVLSFANPILIQQFGSCFADILTAELVLIGWLLLVQVVRAPRLSRVCVAGIFGGAATALKMTNAVHVLATVPILLLLPLEFKSKIKHGLFYAGGAGLAFVGLCAPWSWQLYKQFDNPLFPLLNSLFRSPYFTQETLIHYRFIPNGLWDALIRPFVIVNPVNMIQEELRTPDLRYAVVVALALVMILRAAWRAVRNGKWGWPEINSRSRPFTALCSALAVDWTLWLTGSGNARYFIPGACLTAVVFSVGLFAFFSDRTKLRNYLLLGILSVQGIQLAMGSEFRWNSAPWGGPWFNMEIPQRLRNDDSLFLTIGLESNSFVIPFLAPRAGFVNFSGGYALGASGPEGARIEALIHRYAPRLRVLVAGRKLYEDGDPRDPQRSMVDEALSRFELRVDKGDCDTIVIHGLTPELQPIFLGSSVPVEVPSRDTSYLVSCRLVRAAPRAPSDISEQAVADAALNHLEDACPELFQPKRLLTEHMGRAWMRRYANTDLAAWVSHGQVKFMQSIMGAKITYLGSVDKWAAGALPLKCYRRRDVYGAVVVSLPK